MPSVVQHFWPHLVALVSFAHRSGDEATRRLVDEINDSGHSTVTGSETEGRAFIRVSIGQTHTEERHVDRLWTVIEKSA